ncbi:MBL fold metallo-hydrolase [Alkaliphilus pronyensis]|uniref:MBL fold metallo-hydrolase n=1 Tax=Alkaliphilus pronyensis TaxID=1482732 RepID=A0A6I0F5P6_9FIRM|nr:MBL fold metallo-hydrolase [Alkaliphilus pronyensis]KAB3531305.1 MBL fold metallo-hydrolase [Alkaliphilus pronyensis]
MIRNEITKDLVEYIFEPEEGKHFGNKILALIHGNKVMLIDTAYEYQALEVLEDLKAREQVIDSIIIGHFHDDHMNGLKVLPKATVYGSSQYKTTLDRWTKPEEHKYFTPDIIVKDKMEIEFGEHKITMIPFPGHSICGILIDIDGRYLHIGDELMFSNEGKPLLPCVDLAGVKLQYESTEKLSKYTKHIFIPAHGLTIKGENRIKEEINNVLNYFRNIINSSKKLTYEEATRNCSREFLHSEWFSFIYD